MKKTLNKDEIEIIIKSKGFIFLELIGDDVFYKDYDGYIYNISKYYCDVLGNKFKSKFRKNNINKYNNIQTMMSKNNEFCTHINYDDTISSSDKFEFTCGRCGNKFHSTLSCIENRVYKTCNKCAREIQGNKTLDTETVKNNILKFGYIPLFDKFLGYHNKIDVKDKDGYRGKVQYSTIIKGGGISAFAKYNPYALDNLRLYCEKYSINCIIPEQDYLGRDLPIEIICSCGNKYKTCVSNFIGEDKIQCNYCSNRISNNEKLVIDWLNDNDILYDHQKRFKDCKNKNTLSFDFYFPKNNTCLEIDGEAHFFPVQFGGMNKNKAEISFENQQKKDKIKTDYCKKNNISLIRISYKDINNKKYIEKLKKIFLV